MSGLAFVPQGISDLVGSALLLVDYPDDFQGQAPADSTGTATVSTPTVDPGYYWRAERLTTVVTDGNGILVQPPGGALLMVYKGTQTVASAFCDGSQSPGLDVADQSQPITVQPGLCLTFQWQGLAPGSIAYCTVQYAEYMRVVGGSS